MDSHDTEITLGTAKLLGLFFGLVIVCAVFFALGYTLGRKSDIGLAAANSPTPSPGASSPGTSSPGTSSGPNASGSPTAQPAPAMTFYKAVEQKEANAQLTQAATDASSNPAATSAASSTPGESTPTASTPPASAQTSPAANPPDPMALPAVSYFVQVAAVTKEDDANALVDALKKKQYAAFVAGSPSGDKYLRVQVGPFTDVKEAEAVRTRLINDGYNPILKK